VRYKPAVALRQILGFVRKLTLYRMRSKCETLGFHNGSTKDGTLARNLLTDAQWEWIKDVFPEPAHKGYRANWIDGYLMALEITPVIPSKEDEDHDSRTVEFDKELYRRRAIIEQLIGWLKESRRVFSRLEKTAINFGGFLKIAFMLRYLRLLT